jgi:CheY-like chemotaxis protein
MGKVKQILLAEDNPADVYLLREALGMQKQEFKLTVLTDGEQALNYIDATADPTSTELTPDLIVLDLNLPKSDGSDVLRRIREKPDLQAVPVVVLSSSDSHRDRQFAEKLGADSYITKPSDLDGFLSLGKTLFDFIDGDRANHN